jgi:protein transport protein SEC61 subunit gamma and related proteins
MISKLKEFFKESWRVLKVTKKPDAFEFKTIVKASALGMIIIGSIGFVIFVIRVLVFP